MVYLDSFSLASRSAEARPECHGANHELYKLDMPCYSDNVYPFKLFPDKQLEDLCFEPVTIICGGNGSGKSTILNIIAQKLRLEHTAPWNSTPYFEDYMQLCSYTLDCETLPPRSRIITSDDVFNYLLTLRGSNDDIAAKREELSQEYYGTRKELHYHMSWGDISSVDELDELKRRNEARKSTISKYISRRLSKELTGHSNGESAYIYFTDTIEEGALYLLDEPENSLSAVLQLKLADFLTESARFFGCQFIISTHSPFLLSMKGARIYDLDTIPVCCKRWTELENVRLYHDFFREHENEFR